jgi:hypothetical protein
MFAAEGTSTELPADALAVQLPPLHKDAPAGLGQLWNGPAAGTGDCNEAVSKHQPAWCEQAACQV